MRLVAFAPTGLALLGLVLAGCGREAVQPNLLLIVVDTLRRDYLGCYGQARDTSPSIDALAEQSVVFERAYATAPWTQPSVASLLTGRYPSSHGVDKLFEALPASAMTLAEVLGCSGYATAAVVSHFLIGPRFGFDQGFERFQLTDAKGANEVSTPEVVANATEALRALAEQERPFFLLVHLFDPHHRYLRHEGADFAPRSAGRLRGTENINQLRQLRPPPGVKEVRFIRDLYAGEVRFSDAGIGEILAALDRLPRGKETLVVLTADHGEELFDRNWLGHTRTLYDELIHVPLMIRLLDGEGAGERVDPPVSLVALAPTLLELLGVDAPNGRYQGRSFARVLRGGHGEDEAVYSEVDFATRRPVPGEISKEVRRRALVRGNLKLIEDQFSGALELYDLGRDPRERENLAARDPAATRALLETLERRSIAAKRDVETPGSVAPTAEDSALLRELGYAD